MAQRLATEYVKANLQLTELQMNQFLNSMEHLYVHPKVKVLGSGEQDCARGCEWGGSLFTYCMQGWCIPL